jgi:PKD repeat protein
MTWRKCAFGLSFMLLLGLILTPLGRISYSAVPVTISVNPPMLFAESGESFTVNLTIANAVDVYGWQANLTFDPSVVQCVDATLPPDHFLEGRPEGCVGLQKTIFSSAIVVGTCILGDYLGMHGGGVLVTIEFEVVAAGEIALKVDDTPGLAAWTYVSNHDLEYTVPPDLKTEDGYVSNVDHPPTALFTLSPSLPEVNETTTFDATDSYDPDGYIIRYEWDFGDGDYVNETNPTTTHAYKTEGTYTATLTVIDNATATQKMMDIFNTTTVPHLWYELYSSYSTDVKLRVAHDVVVTSASASPATVTVGAVVTIAITVENQGKETETFNVIVYYDSNTAATTTISDLAPDDEETFQLTWDTTGVTPKTYVMKVNASLVGDANPADNIHSAGSVRVDPPQEPFPMEYVIIGIVVVVAVIGVGAFFLLRRKKSPAT